ncbi:Choline-glycine betaine transporter [Photobacterium marinum]|uniref:Choline-glycine betaine transporter n=1 Tax=Photobacterium marinum TaxID=1056511 RepID=L8J7P2_9GAMM|nr:BCCT family transporter [Photobacterium marinum]ELR64875.1 Choline-glycine betaine transporter [Photobacterium marinum]
MLNEVDVLLPDENPAAKNDKTLITISLVFVFATIALLMQYPDKSQEVAKGLFHGLTNNIGSMVQLFGFLAVCIVLFVGSSKFGSIKLGEGKAEYSDMSWLFMFICAGLGSATMYWAFMEWAYYYNGIGLNIPAQSNESLRSSLSYVFFHWGITPWAIYALASIAMAYHFHVNKSKGLNLSSLVASILGLDENSNISRLIGRALDLTFLFATFGGLILTTTVTIGTVSTGFASLFNIENTFLLKAVLLAFVTLTFTLSSYIGISEGLQKIAHMACGMTFVFGLIVLCLGDTSFIVDFFVNSLGLSLSNFVEMSLFTDVTNNGTFNKDWTVFYWLYWITYTPGVSIFVTRISKGRTIRQVIFGLIAGGCAGCWFFFGSLSGYAVDMFNSGVINSPEILTSVSGDLAIAQLIANLPMGTVLSVFYFLLMMVFLASHLDATAYTVAAVSTQGLKQGQDPTRALRLFWCIMLSLLPLAMLYINASLSTLKTAVTLTAAPFIVVLILCILGLKKFLSGHNFGK